MARSLRRGQETRQESIKRRREAVAEQEAAQTNGEPDNKGGAFDTITKPIQVSAKFAGNILEGTGRAAAGLASGTVKVVTERDLAAPVNGVKNGFKQAFNDEAKAPAGPEIDYRAEYEAELAAKRAAEAAGVEAEAARVEKPAREDLIPAVRVTNTLDIKDNADFSQVTVTEPNADGEQTVAFKSKDPSKPDTVIKRDPKDDSVLIDALNNNNLSDGFESGGWNAIIDFLGQIFGIDLSGLKKEPAAPKAEVEVKPEAEAEVKQPAIKLDEQALKEKAEAEAALVPKAAVPNVETQDVQISVENVTTYELSHANKPQVEVAYSGSSAHFSYNGKEYSISKTEQLKAFMKEGGDVGLADSIADRLDIDDGVSWYKEGPNHTKELASYIRTTIPNPQHPGDLSKAIVMESTSERVRVNDGKHANQARWENQSSNSFKIGGEDLDQNAALLAMTEMGYSDAQIAQISGNVNSLIKNDGLEGVKGSQIEIAVNVIKPDSTMEAGTEVAATHPEFNVMCLGDELHKYENGATFMSTTHLSQDGGTLITNYADETTKRSTDADEIAEFKERLDYMKSLTPGTVKTVSEIAAEIKEEKQQNTQAPIIEEHQSELSAAGPAAGR